MNVVILLHPLRALSSVSAERDSGLPAGDERRNREVGLGPSARELIRKRSEIRSRFARCPAVDRLQEWQLGVSVGDEAFHQARSGQEIEPSLRGLLGVPSAPPGSNDLGQGEELHAPGEDLEYLAISARERLHQGRGERGRGAAILGSFLRTHLQQKCSQ